MILRMLRPLFVCLLAVAFILPALPTIACGPDYPNYVFVSTDQPDAPPDGYAAGKLDIVMRSYVPSHLVVAYRYFSGKPLSADEQSQFVDLWNKYNSSSPQDTAATADSSGWDDSLQEWAQRADFQAPTVRQNSRPNGNAAYLSQTYQSYENCYTDAYATAANTLRARAQEFGDDSPAVRSWAQAQVAVFQNCTAPGSATPGPAASDLPLEIRKDRDYQIAAANFYGNDWDNAEKEFLTISNDPSSPWRAIAGLVAARCEIRKGTMGTDDPDERDKDFSAADDQLKKIIADPAFASVKPAAESLRGFVEFRSDPEDRAVELSGLLQRDIDPDHFAQNVDDYTKLIRDTADSFVKDQALREKSDMTDWMLSFRGFPNDAAEAHSISRWQQTHSLAWLVAALKNEQKNSPDIAPLLQAAAKVHEDSPAYLTLAYERDRILAASERETEARQNVDKLLAMPQDSMSVSSRNTLLGLRMNLAANLNEFLRFAPRVSASPEGGGPMFDDDSAPAFAKALPLSSLSTAVHSKTLPDALRDQVATAAWTRAVLLHNDQAALELAPAVASVSSDLKDEFAPYLAAKDAADREFAAVFILLHTAGLKPYVDSATETFDPHGNWWCSAKPVMPRQPPMYDAYRPSPDTAPEQFLSPTERDRAATEWAALSALPAGSNWLIEQTLGWAKTHPNDPRIPEALHFGVRATRYGCGDNGTGTLSKQAFDLLHHRYSNSDWTKQTPYWFN